MICLAPIFYDIIHQMSFVLNRLLTGGFITMEARYTYDMGFGLVMFQGAKLTSKFEDL